MHQRQKFHIDDVMSGGIWSGALIGRRIVVTLFQLSYTNDDEKQRERTNGNAINLLQNSLYSWNIYCFLRRNIRVLLELVRRRT